MRRTMRDWWPVFAAAVIADPTIARAAATDLLQIDAPDLTNAEANEWWDAIGVLYESIGVINQPTYAALRNEIEREGEVVAIALFSAMNEAIQAMPETVLVEGLLGANADGVELATIPGSIATVETNKADSVDDLLDAAYDQAIIYLISRQTALTP